MRLICPNCGAQYEVPDDVIPEAGRDVQCSNCGVTWFQPHPDQDVELAEELERALPDQEWQPEEPEPEPEPEPEIVPAEAIETEVGTEAEDTAPAAPQRRELDPAIADVLRQEAEHEARVRQAEAGSLESQPDLGLEEPETEAARRAREARSRMSRLRGEPETPEPSTPVAEADLPHGSRGDILPDIEEINSTLRSTGDRKADKAAKGTAPANPTAYRRRRGFRSGFGLTLILAAVAVLAYVNADRIVEAVPQSKPYMTLYVTKVNEARVWLDTQMVDAMLWLDEKAKAAGGNPSSFGDVTPPETSSSN